VRGHIRERGRGTWELRVFLGRDPITRRDRYKTRTFKGLKKDAEKELRNLLSTVEAGVVSEGTFGELLERWYLVAATSRDWSPKTVAEHRRIIDKMLGPLSDLALHKVRTPLIDTFYAGFRTHGGRCGHEPRRDHERELCEVGAPLSAATVRRIHAVVHSALEQAVAWDLLQFNPASKASPGRTEAREIHVPTVDEVLQMLKQAETDDPDPAVFLILAAVTGARRGELCALRWDDVDFGSGCLRISRVIALGKDGPVERRKPKTRSSMRTIALDAGTLGVLAAHRARSAEKARTCGVDLAPSAFIFTGQPDGSEPWRPDSTSRRVRTVRKACDIDEEIHLHSLRHFVVTMLLGAGVALPQVAGRVGRSGGGTTTLAVYSHFQQAQDQEVADLLGLILNPQAAVEGGD
jgi:integrase